MFRLKKEEAARLKENLDKEKELAEMDDIMRNCITNPELKLNLPLFTEKIEHQVRKWLEKRNIDPNLCNYSQHVGSSTYGSNQKGHSETENTFKPTILKKSKELANHIDKIENRYQRLKDLKQIKISKIG